MRELQITGIVVSFLIGGYGLWKYKRGRYSRVSFTISLALAGSLFVIALFPSAGDIVAGPLKMERWNAVLVVSNLITFGLFFYVLDISVSNARTISQLVKALACSGFREEHQAHEGSEIAVVIPAYNEEGTIADVLRRIPKQVLGMKTQTFVVVDGGTDGTERIARAMATPVVVNPINRGGGAALRAGYDMALESGAEIIVTLDGDGQHLPEEIPDLVKPIVDDEADFVNGSRTLGSFESESRIRVLGVFFFNWLLSFLMFTRITDCSNAFRAVRADTLRKLTLRQDQFHTSELLIEALKKGARVKEVGITIRQRQGGVTKKPPSLKYGWGFARAIISTWLR
jgi:cellulose synthase/poly-beta-1,6-N-acetylglucosamine synthase-like glycosyltransferase